MSFAERLRARAAAAETHKIAPVAKTGQLYRVPRMHAQGATPAAEPWAAECITWPRYVNGVFALPHKDFAIEGESMLELTQEEKDAVRIVVLV